MSAKARLEKLEAQAGKSPQENRREQIERENDERLQREYEAYCVIGDKLTATIPEPYDEIICADFEALTDDELWRVIYGGGFLGASWGHEISELFKHVLTLAKAYQRASGLEVPGGYLGPFEVPAATCAILAQSKSGEVEFRSANMSGWECRECGYWMPCKASEANKSNWGEPILSVCPCCCGVPANFNDLRERRERRST